MIAWRILGAIVLAWLLALTVVEYAERGRVETGWEYE